MIERLLIDPFAYAYMQRALIEVLILGLLGAVVGVHVFLRRLAFLTEALQHTVFPGIAIAFVAGQSLLLGAAAAALFTVLLLTGLSRRPGVREDSVLPVLISGFFALGVVVVSRSESYQHDLTQLLFGRLLAVDLAQIVETAAIAAVVIAVLVLLHKELVLRAFDARGFEALGYRSAVLDLVLNLAVAAAVIAAVRAVGTVLLVAFIVTPAAAARLVTIRVWMMMVVAAVVTAIAGWIGLGLSYDLSVNHGIDTGSGATVVLAITAVFLCIAAVRAARGLKARSAA